ncbi:hypothetical protein B0H14DRAFT_2574312 [Mycena olivaceomarginata]|nr:hypothetical protein B0H14DRAFT_2574312 [Mycena olivaceomarginata]
MNQHTGDRLLPCITGNPQLESLPPGKINRASNPFQSDEARRFDPVMDPESRKENRLWRNVSQTRTRLGGWQHEPLGMFNLGLWNPTRTEGWLCRPLGTLSNPKKPLLERLQSTQDAGKRMLMEQMEVGLREQVLMQKTSVGHRHADNRPKKCLERLLRLKAEIQLEWEEMRWTDMEINWIIDQEEMLRPFEADDDPMDLD